MPRHGGIENYVSKIKSEIYFLRIKTLTNDALLMYFKIKAACCDITIFAKLFVFLEKSWDLRFP